jgi:lipopolysaccharide export system permease protein
MNNAELERYIVWQELKATGQVTPFLLEKYGRIAIPFSTFILTLIGVSVSSKKARGGMGVQLGIGIGISFVYVVMMRFTMIFATQADLPPLLAAWIPNIVFGIVAIIMVRLAPK